MTKFFYRVATLQFSKSVLKILLTSWKVVFKIIFVLSCLKFETVKIWVVESKVDVSKLRTEGAKVGCCEEVGDKGTL